MYIFIYFYFLFYIFSFFRTSYMIRNQKRQTYPVLFKSANNVWALFVLKEVNKCKHAIEENDCKQFSFVFLMKAKIIAIHGRGYFTEIGVRYLVYHIMYIWRWTFITETSACCYFLCLASNVFLKFNSINSMSILFKHIRMHWIGFNSFKHWYNWYSNFGGFLNQNI